ncbi:YciI family protein [Microbulbifer sediminum]|uniref:YciI family protein n=1 Tax=Microbulbifer sediminum TaxID=2904250 RepID=UPI001F488D7D|nr:YciI family protein [Microbulbifer sediminum]
MKFMLLMIPDGYRQAEPGTLPDCDRVAAMMEYNRQMEEAGVLLSLEGLHPPSMGARVTFASGEPVVMEGSRLDATESLGGFWLIEVDSKNEAIDWARRCPATSGETIEVRQVQEMVAFPEEIRELVDPEAG